MNLLTHLQTCLATATRKLAPDAPLGDSLKPTKDPKFGDYQANGAMALAKALGKKPQDLARELVAKLNAQGLESLGLEPPQVAGPGFINLRFTSGWLERQLTALARDERLGVPTLAQPRTYVIDYSSPNVAKPMHVGHLRS
ncbi:MAG TPA: arginine--tRNA ligase, partial [Gemmatales bacterium]|nr:arginine--tRNA ligase [Gemmatales bacterium]